MGVFLRAYYRRGEGVGQLKNCAYYIINCALVTVKFPVELFLYSSRGKLGFCLDEAKTQVARGHILSAPSCQVNRAIIAGVLSFEGKKRQNPFVGKGSKCIKGRFLQSCFCFCEKEMAIDRWWQKSSASQ